MQMRRRAFAAMMSKVEVASWQICVTCALLRDTCHLMHLHCS